MALTDDQRKELLREAQTLAAQRDKAKEGLTQIPPDGGGFLDGLCAPNLPHKNDGP